jgi:hypothetical protein
MRLKEEEPWEEQATYCCVLASWRCLPSGQRPSRKAGLESGWTEYPPNLNGKLGPGEWAGATRVKLYPLESNGATGLEGKLGHLILGEAGTEPQ